jgi:hypothetical protein
MEPRVWMQDVGGQWEKVKTHTTFMWKSAMTNFQNRTVPVKLHIQEYDIFIMQLLSEFFSKESDASLGCWATILKM